jgi:hypothetical protein
VILNNGKKFDPIPIEEGFRELDFVEEAIVFGQNKESPGVLVFPSRPGSLPETSHLIHALPAINMNLPSYAQIVPELVVIIQFGRDWPKSSKGTALRNKAEEIFSKEIEQARHHYETGNGPRLENGRPLGPGPSGLEGMVAGLISHHIRQSIGPNEDLFMAGVDSIMATNIRRALMRRIQRPLPTNVVFEQRTVKKFPRPHPMPMVQH